MTARERFSQDHGIDIDRVDVMCRLAHECKLLGEHACNGDPHPHNPAPDDKSRNSELWSHVCNVAAAELLRYASKYGFTEVAFTGLYPCLKRGEQFIDLPL